MSSDRRTGQQIVLSRNPEGALKASDFAIVPQEIPAIKDRHFLVRNKFISVDPMLRIFVDQSPLGGNMPGLPAGSPIAGAAVGEIIESQHPDFAVGELVEGRFGWQDYALSNGYGVQRVNPRIGPPQTALGIGGLPGFTAYVGLDVAQLQPNQSILVSGAAGAVGSAVGAFVAARGGRAVGIAGGTDKKRYLLEEVGYAAVADRNAPDFLDQLKEALPQGANVYFDNVGGPLLATVMPHMTFGGLVLICGLMSQYQGQGRPSEDALGPVLAGVMTKGVRIQGFSQFGKDDMRPAFEEELAQMMASGNIASTIHVEQGMDRLPHALVGLFEKSQAGKVVVQVA